MSTSVEEPTAPARRGTFAGEGATVFLAGRTLATLDRVARDISAAGGTAEAAVVDALDERAIGEHADEVAADAGSIDIALNAIGIGHVQGAPLAELSLGDYSLPVATYTRTNFLTAKAVARSPRTPETSSAGSRPSRHHRRGHAGRACSRRHPAETPADAR